MSQLKIKRILPVRFIRKMRGGSQCSLIEASDGLQYVVKWKNNPQGSQIVLNEALGTLLYQQVGLATPPCAAMEIADDFIDANRGMWFESRRDLIRPTAGLHFASLCLGTGTQTVYEVLPGSWFTRIQDRSSFLGALVADVWSEHVDSRQALFLQDNGERFLSAVYIDHGHMFGGPDGAQVARLRACFYLDMRIYSGLGLVDGIGYWTERIKGCGETIIADAVSAVPEEWMSTSVERIVDRLLINLPRLHDMLFPAIFRWINHETQKPPQIHAYPSSQRGLIQIEPLRTSMFL